MAGLCAAQNQLGVPPSKPLRADMFKNTLSIFRDWKNHFFMDHGSFWKWLDSQFGFMASMLLFPLLFALDLLDLLWQLPLAFWKARRERIDTARRREKDLADDLRRREDCVIQAQRQLEQQRRQSETAERQAVDQQRRVEARAQCELLFGRHVHEIESRFPKEMLDSFMLTYMNDNQPVEAVERRGKELQRSILLHLEEERPVRKYLTIDELADWFVKEKQRIESLPIEEELREEHLVQLNMRYAELTQDMLQRMTPS